MQWDPIPTKQRNGEVLGYNVEIKPDDQMQGGKTIEAMNFTTSLSLTFNTLKKYCKYEVSVYGLTRRGKGPARVLTVQTAEDGKPSWENLLYLRKWRFHYPVETYIICHALSTTTYGLEIITNELKHLDS